MEAAERAKREKILSLSFLCDFDDLCQKFFAFVHERFSLAKIKRRQKRRRREENLIKMSFSKREKREISFSDLFSVIPEKKTSAK